MPGGRAADLHGLPAAAHAVLDRARRGVLSTIDVRGRPHSVPVCFAKIGDELVTPVDAKPKKGGRLGRARNIERDPRVTLLVDVWDEDWTKLAWVMVRGRARIESTDVGSEELERRYPQYRETSTGDDAIVIAPDEILWWSWSDPGPP